MTIFSSQWAILGLKPTDDLTTVKRTYARLIKTVDPETDSAHFQRIRDAYEQIRDQLEKQLSERALPDDTPTTQPFDSALASDWALFDLAPTRDLARLQERYITLLEEIDRHKDPQKFYRLRHAFHRLKKKEHLSFKPPRTRTKRRPKDGHEALKRIANMRFSSSTTVIFQTDFYQLPALQRDRLASLKKALSLPECAPDTVLALINNLHRSSNFQTAEFDILNRQIFTLLTQADHLPVSVFLSVSRLYDWQNIGALPSGINAKQRDRYQERFSLEYRYHDLVQQSHNAEARVERCFFLPPRKFPLKALTLDQKEQTQALLDTIHAQNGYLLNRFREDTLKRLQFLASEHAQTISSSSHTLIYYVKRYWCMAFVILSALIKLIFFLYHAQ